MTKITHPVYKEYAEQPYIAPTRDLEDWIEHPEKYPYSIIEKKKMVRFDEGILPGDLIMLWRIHFGNFTNETWIPEYFEYRYGVNSDESIELLLKLKMIEITKVNESLSLYNSTQLKGFLKSKELDQKGKKQDLVDRVYNSFTEKELEELSSTRAYRITEFGKKVLDAHQDVIKQHGMKG